MTYLLDNCVISELVAKKPSQRVVAWIDVIDEERLFLSVITIGEIRKGISKLGDSRRRNTLQDWLDRELCVRFQDRILVIDMPVMLRWGELTAAAEASGLTISAMDSLIAATALFHDLDLVTRNVADFEQTGVRIVNPWESAAQRPSR